MTYENPPGGNAGPPGGYGEPSRGNAGPPGGYGEPPRGNAGPPGGYGGPPPGGYGGAPPPGGYGPPSPGGYGAPPGGYVSQAGNYSNWLYRVGAYVIDAIPVAILVGIGAATRNTAVYFLFLLAGIAVWAYNRWFQAGKTGQSWGKKALNMDLIGEQTGQPIGAGQAFLRDICHIIDSITCYIGWLFPIWDAKRQTFADKIMRTVVIPST
jgi:RDD family